MLIQEQGFWEFLGIDYSLCLEIDTTVDFSSYVRSFVLFKKCKNYHIFCFITKEN
jgi:hypothetical protein